MNNTGIPAADAVAQTLQDTKGYTAFLTGSSASAIAYDKPDAYTDIDLFVPSEGMYFVLIQHLLSLGYVFGDDRGTKAWRRQQIYGFNKWHTNSMKLLAPSGTEVNVIYKLVDGHATTQLSQVIESFDFGLLAMGYETSTGAARDMRSYLFPGMDPLGPLPMLHYRTETVGRGLMSQHVMMRAPGRYARYASSYGYDLSLVKPVLHEGLMSYAEYKLDRTKADDVTMGNIAYALAGHLEFDEFDELLEFERKLPMADSLDDIMANLE